MSTKAKKTNPWQSNHTNYWADKSKKQKQKQKRTQGVWFNTWERPRVKGIKFGVWKGRGRAQNASGSSIIKPKMGNFGLRGGGLNELHRLKFAHNHDQSHERIRR